MQDSLGKQAIDCQDRAGFVVNALLIPFILSAIRMCESGFASAEDIDRGLVLGAAHPQGPLALADLIGLDTTKAVAESLYEEFKEPLYAAPPLLQRMVDAGLLGRKTGRGFYTYSGGTSMSSDFPLFALSEEHRAIREAVRALCEAKVAPYAADVDEQARYPEEAAAALLAADFHAPHVPEEYGGAGADALATVLVIEEIARVDMSRVADPGGQQARLAAGPAGRVGGAQEALPRRAGRAARVASPTACPSPTPARTRSR